MSGYVTYVPVQIVSGTMPPNGFAAPFYPQHMPSSDPYMTVDPSLMYPIELHSGMMYPSAPAGPMGASKQPTYNQSASNNNNNNNSTRQHNPYAAVAIVQDEALQPQGGLAHPHQQGHEGWAEGPAGTGQRAGVRGGASTNHQVHHTPVSLDEVIAHQGTYTELARTANGSSFIQSALREGSDEANLQIIWSELRPQFADLLLDAHGCYVIKSILERLPAKELNEVVTAVASDEQLVFSMCTHSLHTRRVVQFLLDTVDCSFIIALLTAHCAEIATTQQGCIVLQRAMDVAREPQRTALFSVIYANIVPFATDPFGNYVVQHLLEVGERNANSAAFMSTIGGQVVMLSCNKFASNVMEKAMFHLNPDAQHAILMEMYGGGEDVLYRMLQDSFGNYIIQSSIALASFKDVFYMNEKLRPVLQRTPYGHKIEARLDRRLKGKPVGTRSPMIGTYGRGGQAGAQPAMHGRGGHHHQQPAQQNHHHGARGGHNQQHPYEAAEHEEPW